MDRNEKKFLTNSEKNGVKPEANLYVDDKKMKRLPKWLLPVLIIVFLFLLILFTVPSLVKKFSPGDHSNSLTNTQVINEFIEKADAVVNKKISGIFDEPALTSSCITSALYNEPLNLLSENPVNNFYEVELQDGIRGYIRKDDIFMSTESLLSDKATSKAIIVNGEKSIASDTINGDIIAVAPMGSILYVDYATEQVIHVLLPDQQAGWMNRENLILIPTNMPIPQPEKKKEDIFCSSAMKFLNVAYVPGGLGLDGIDMTGIIYLSGMTNGLEIPRDLRRQSGLGRQISLEEDASGFPNLSGLKAGDILFFNDPSDQEPESSAIYLADNNILYAYGNDAVIQIISLSDNEKLWQRLDTARRLFD